MPSENGNHQNLNQIIRVDVEPRKMRLMFGERKEGQVVKLRSDGIRSQNLRRNPMEMMMMMPNNSTIDNVGQSESTVEVGGNEEQSSSSGSGSGQQQVSGEDDESPSSSSRVHEILQNVVNESAASTSTTNNSSSAGLMRDSLARPASVVRWNKIQAKNASSGNKKYHPPGKYHGASTMVEHKKRWTYQMACDINAAEQDGDGQMYYVADPFLPMPRSRQGAPTAVRMNYAAQRLDNRKFRNQVATVKSIAEQESALCDRCGMRFFMPSINMQQRITYLPPVVEEDLPTVLFECPVCKSKSKAQVFS